MSEKWEKKEIFPIPVGWESFNEDNFNDWLAENIQATVGVILKIDFSNTERESKNEDNKRLDILASYQSEEDCLSYVAIETQLNLADFDHFGRLIMYMASNEKKPTIGVWIVKASKPSHTKSIEWLNQNTLTEFDFWLLSVKTITVANQAVGIEIVTLVKPDQMKRELYQEKKNIEIKQEKKRRKENFNFKKLDISIGSELIYEEDNNIKCIVTSEVNKVEYEGSEYTLSGLTNELKRQSPSYGILPLQHWFYTNDSGEKKKLSDIRKEKDLEEKKLLEEE